MKTIGSIIYNLSGCFLCLLLLLWTNKIDSQIRITKVDPFTDQVTLHNFNSSGMTNIATYWFCTRRVYAPLNTATVISGSMALNAGADVVIVVNTSGGLNNVSSDLSIYLNNAFGNSANMVDFMQYGDAFPGSTGRENEAVAQALWVAGTFILGDPAPWSYIGNGADNGVDFWTSSTLDVREEQLKASLAIYPIPVSNTLTLKKLLNINLKELSIYDSQGRVLLREDLSNLFIEKNVSLANLANGIYLLNIKDDKGAMITKKIIKF